MPKVQDVASMRVGDWMTPSPLTLPPETSLLEAADFLRTHSIRHLPLVSGGRLCGIVSDRDIKLATPSPLDPDPAYDRPVSTIMNADVITIGPDDSLVDAARLMRHRKIRCLPVTSADRLVGIITDTDVLDAFLSASGGGKRTG